MSDHDRLHVLHHELFVVQLDGHVKSTHERFVEALRAAMSLRDEFPKHQVKVRAAPATLPQGDIKRGAALH
jgi:hypothetical protein